MAEEKKPAETQQAPADGKPAEQKPEVKPGATGLDSFTRDQLKDLYKKSPELFEGVVEQKKPTEEIPKPTETPQSAAPVEYAGEKLKIPEDVPVAKEAVELYLAHAKEHGLTAKQVQAELDFQAKLYRAAAGSKKDPTPQELDAQNVGLLKKEFGNDYDKNMEIARQAAVEFADAEMLAKMKTSDPVLVRHFLKIGLKNANDKTPEGGTPRNGNETDDAAKDEASRLKARYPRSPQMFNE